MIRFYAIIVFGLSLLLAIGVMLMNIIGGVLPYDGEIRYFIQPNRGDTYIPYTMDVARGLIYRTRTPITFRQVLWESQHYIAAWIDEATYIVPADGGEARELSQGTVYPAWSPDSAYLTFNYFSITYLASGDGTALDILTPQGSVDNYPAFSPDSTRLAFTRDDDLYIMTLSDRSITRVTNTPERQENLMSWSPNGQWLSFRWFNEGLEFVGVVGIDGQNYTEAPYSLEIYSVVRWWSPDSRRFSYFTTIPAGDELAEKRVVVLPLDGGQARMFDITFPNMTWADMTWLDDNQTLIVSWGYQSSDGSPNLLYADSIDSQTGELLRRQQLPGIYLIDLSPDGRLAVGSNMDTICIIPYLSGGDTRCLALDSWVTHVHWNP